mgnify:CR=1 FL=1
MKKIRLGDIATLITKGTTPTTIGFSFVDTGVNFVKIESIGENGEFLPDKFARITDECDKKLRRSQLEENDILFSIAGAIGRTAIVPSSILPANTNQALAIIRIPQNAINLRFVLYALQSQAVEEQSEKQKQGVAQLNLSLKNIADILIPLVSSEKQDEIVRNLAAIDAAIALRKEQIRLIDQLVKSRFVEMFGDIQETVPLSYYIRGLSAGKSLAGEDECINKVLKTGATTYDYFDSTQVKNLPLDYIPQEEHRVKTGDVIISRMNTAELVGAAAYVWKAPDHTYLPDRLWKAEVRNTACPIFVWQLLIQKDTKESIRRIASGTSGSMKNISKPGVLGIRVIKVEIAAQNRFAAFVAEVDKSKFRIQKSLSTSRKLWTMAQIDAIMNMDFSTQRSL